MNQCPNCGEPGPPEHHYLTVPGFQGYVCRGKDECAWQSQGTSEEIVQGTLLPPYDSELPPYLESPSGVRRVESTPPL